jgi:hypothetical protein
MNTAAVTESASVEERAAAALFGTPVANTKPKEAPNTEVPEPQEPSTNEPTAELPEGQEAATGDEPIADETFEFEHEGQKWALPKPLEKALQNNRDYTQKSQEIANQRRVLEALNEQAKIQNLTREFESSISGEMQQLAAYDQVLSTPLNTNQSQEELLKAMVQRNQWEKERENIARQVQQRHQQYVQNHEKALSEAKAKALEAVSKRVPGWNDALWNAVREHARSDGYTDVELGSINDPRHQITLWKAQQYDMSKAKATQAVAQVKAVKTTPSNPMPQHVKDKLNFRKALERTTDPIQRKGLVEAQVGRLFAKK